MKIQEVSEDIARWRNYVPSSKTSYMEEKHPKYEETTITRKKKHLCAPRV